MVNYKDPQVMLGNAALFAKFILVLLGFLGWETLTALSFDWEVITRKRTFKWPMIFYWLCKYCMFFALIGLTIATNATGVVNCQALYVFNQFGGNFAIGSASTLLMLRAMAIWSQNVYVVVPLVVLSLGQWGILLHGLTNVSASWSDAAGACLVTDAPPVFISLIFLYTMSFDFIVLVTSTIGLMVTPGRNRTGLWNLLFSDGLIYFIIAFSANCVPAILLLLDLNPVLNVIGAVPAASTTSVAACRAFVRLTTWKSKDVYVHTTQVHTTTKYSSNRTAASKFGGKGKSGVNSEPFAIGGVTSQGGDVSSDSVHVQMDTMNTYFGDDDDARSFDMEGQKSRKHMSSFGPELKSP